MDLVKEPLGKLLKDAAKDRRIVVRFKTVDFNSDEKEKYQQFALPIGNSKDQKSNVVRVSEERYYEFVHDMAINGYDAERTKLDGVATRGNEGAKSILWIDYVE